MTKLTNIVIKLLNFYAKILKLKLKAHDLSKYFLSIKRRLTWYLRASAGEKIEVFFAYFYSTTSRKAQLKFSIEIPNGTHFIGSSGGIHSVTALKIDIFEDGLWRRYNRRKCDFFLISNTFIDLKKKNQFLF